MTPRSPFPVSPGFRLRPSLSDGDRNVQHQYGPILVSPGFRLRPSLSGPDRRDIDELAQSETSVAGVQTPAFVERIHALYGALMLGIPRVAGVQTPAFVERSAPRA